MKIYLASDHGGFELKQELVEFVRELGHEAEDCGAFSYDKDDDYPEFIGAAARKLSADSAQDIDSRAVVLGASGQGEAMVANRFPGVRCALYYGAPGKRQTDMSGKELDMLASSRIHNNANALSLGARFLSVDEAKKALKDWLSVDFPAEARHQRRINQIDTVLGK